MALLPVDEALARLLDRAEPKGPESVPLAEAIDRVLAEPLTARRTQPPFDASAMDGYAVRSSDIQAIPARLKVIGTAPAGKAFDGTVVPLEAGYLLCGLAALAMVLTAENGRLFRPQARLVVRHSPAE